MEVLAWRLGERNWNPDNILRDGCILGYGYKWLFQPGAVAKVLTPKEAIAQDDKRIVQDIWNILEKADIVIAHNGDYFDFPWVNAQFLKHGLPVPSPYQTVDTRTAAKKAFRFPSYKLDYIAKRLGLPTKYHTDFDLWKQCREGNPAALEYMRNYNEQDIYVLEDVYVALRPWIKHPNMSLYVVVEGDMYVCPHCGSDDFDPAKKYRTPAGVFDSFRCNNCGAVGRWHKRGFSSKSRVIMK